VKRTSESDQSDPKYWDGLRLIASNVEFIVSDGPQPMTPGSFSLLAVNQGQSAPRPRSMLAAAASGEFEDDPRWFHLAVPILGDPSSTLHEAILAVLPGADQLGTTRQERIAVLRSRLTELESYRWLVNGVSYVDAKKAVEKAGKRKGGKFASDVAEFALLRTLIGPLSMFELARAIPAVLAEPKRPAVEAALKAAQKLQAFFVGHGGVYVAENVDVLAVHGLHKITASLQAMLRAAHKAPQDKETARQILYLDSLAVQMHQEFGACDVPTLLALAGIVDYRPDSANLYARVKRIAAAL
jgi:hypothetical protein